MFRAVFVIALVTVAGCTRANPAFWAPTAAADAEASEAGPLPKLVPPDAAPDVLGPDRPPAAAPDAGAPDTASKPASVPSIVINGSTETDRFGNNGGEQYIDICPMNQVLIGYRISGHGLDFPRDESSYVTYVQAICGQLIMRPDGTDRIWISGGEVLDARGAGHNPLLVFCPPDEVIVGFSGRAGSSVDRLQFRCARLSAEGIPPTSIKVGEPRPLEPIGGTGGDVISADCEPGQVARGHHVRSGSWLDAFGLVCGTPSFVPVVP
jgi:hypothetical protein